MSKTSAHFLEMEKFLRSKIIQMKKMGDEQKDKEFKALAMGIEEAVEGPNMRNFSHSFHFSKAVNAVIHRKDLNPLSLEATKIRTEVNLKYKPDSLSPTEKIAIELVLALLTFYILGKYTEWVERLFERANEEAFA
ncbi:hypothetical protein IPJ63_01610 [Candidatus Nomurabacteria bacterium]|nr:hypothetical protein [Candidatus Paceibacterota bacterium]QQR76938.1 MAG: hypothetical protein IPJ63_01610 [Candidatus Nomurabacteria bacterium]